MDPEGQRQEGMVEDTVDGTGQVAASLLMCDAGPWMDEWSTKTWPEASIEANRPQMTDALVTVVSTGDESQRGAMFERQSFAFQCVREQDVVGQGILQEQAGGIAVGSLEPQMPYLRVRIRPRHDELVIEIGKPVPTPADPQATPRGDAMEVREVFPSRQRGEPGETDLARDGDVPDDLEAGPRGGLGPTACERKQTVPREVSSRTLATWQDGNALPDHTSRHAYWISNPRTQG